MKKLWFILELVLSLILIYLLQVFLLCQELGLHNTGKRVTYNHLKKYSDNDIIFSTIWKHNAGVCNVYIPVLGQLPGFFFCSVHRISLD